MTITGNVLELDLDPKIHTAEILLTMPLYVWGSVFAGWTTPDMLLHHDVTFYAGGKFGCEVADTGVDMRLDPLLRH